MAAAGLTVIAAPALETTITSMGSQTYDADSIETWRVYGYENGVNRWNYTTINGTIGNDTYTDGGSTSRTISAIYYHEAGSPNGESDDLVLNLNATGIPDSNTVFVSLEYNGELYTRASRNIFDDTTGSATSWTWTNISPNGPTSGNPVVIINI